MMMPTVKIMGFVTQKLICYPSGLLCQGCFPHVLCFPCLSTLASALSSLWKALLKYSFLFYSTEELPLSHQDLVRLLSSSEIFLSSLLQVLILPWDKQLASQCLSHLHYQGITKQQPASTVSCVVIKSSCLLRVCI